MPPGKAIQRKSPLRRKDGPAHEQGEHPRAKEAKTPKERTCICGASFTPKRMEHVVCSPRCLVRHKAAKAKAEKESVKARKEKLKSTTKWEQECRSIVQKIARLRDRHDGCISCHMGANYGGQWHGSHYRSVGASSNTQFLLWNIHKACAQCNLHKGGNREFYRPRLIEKIGLERVEWLDAQNQVVKRSGPAYIEYLKRFKQVMGKRLRRMEKRAAA